LSDIGFQLYATKGTQEYLKTHGGITSCIPVFKPLTKREPNALTLLRDGTLDLVINVPTSMDSQALSDGFAMRRAAVDSGVPLLVEIKTAILVAMALERKWSREKSGKAFWSFKSWQEYVDPKGNGATGSRN